MMADLYTSQVHLKRILEGRATPAFTSPPPDVSAVFDPELFPGMGALNEDASGRLQCPVRECGEWHFHIGRHWSRQHKGVGNVATIKNALGFAKSQSILSKVGRTMAKSGGGRPFVSGGVRTRAAVVRSNRDRRGQSTSLMSRNVADTCPAQLQEKLAALARELGRHVTVRDFAAAYGGGAVKAIRRVFGTWDNAKALAGLDLSPHGVGRGGFNGTGASMGRPAVLVSLKSWYDAHGDLPSYRDVSNADRAPRIPSSHAIQSAFGVDNWRAAMRSAAENLGVSSEQYGFYGFER